MAPKEVVINQATGRISHLVLARTEQDEDTGEWKIDEEETLKKVKSSLKRVLVQKKSQVSYYRILAYSNFHTNLFLSVAISSFLHLAPL